MGREEMGEDGVNTDSKFKLDPLLEFLNLDLGGRK